MELGAMTVDYEWFIYLFMTIVTRASQSRAYFRVWLIGEAKYLAGICTIWRPNVEHGVDNVRELVFGLL